MDEELQAKCGDDKYLIWIVDPLSGKVIYDEREGGPECLKSEG